MGGGVVTAVGGCLGTALLGCIPSIGIAAIPIIHGWDDARAGLTTAITGQFTETYTQQIVTAGAGYIPGVSDEMAANIGLGVDVLAGLGAGTLGDFGAASVKYAREAVKVGLDVTEQSVRRGLLRAARGHAAKNLRIQGYGAAAGAAVGVAYTDTWNGALFGAQWGSIAGGLTAAVVNPCFPAGTPILTPEGSKPIEELRPGDLVLSRDEYNVDGEVASKRIEEVFVRHGEIYELVYDDGTDSGRRIELTPEHPLYVRGKGWTPAGEVEVDDEVSTIGMLRGADPHTGAVDQFYADDIWSDGPDTSVATISQTESVVHTSTWSRVVSNGTTGRFETVYNFRVPDWGTYFVGDTTWQLNIWVHNSTYNLDLDEALGDLTQLRSAAGLENAQRGLDVPTQAHHPFFRMFLRAMDEAGVGNPRSASGRYVSQSLAYVDTVEHRSLHSLWDQHVLEQGFGELRAIRGNGELLAESFKTGRLTPSDVADMLNDFYINQSRNGLDTSAAWLSLQSLRSRTGI